MAKKSKNKIFSQARVQGKSVEEAMQIAGIKDLKELELSGKRSVSGTKSAEKRGSILIEEQNRRLRGKKFESEWETEKVAFNQEITDARSEQFVGYAYSILQSVAWNLAYPPPPDQFDYDEHVAGVCLEERKYFSLYPDVALLDLIDYAKYGFKLSEPLRQLLIRVLTEYLGWQEKQPQNLFDPKDTSEMRRTLARLTNGEDIFIEPEHEKQEKPKLKSVEEQLREYHEQYAKYGTGGDPSLSVFATRDSLADQAALQEQQEEERRILAEVRQRSDEAQRVQQEQQRRNLPTEAFNFLHGRSMLNRPGLGLVTTTPSRSKD